MARYWRRCGRKFRRSRFLDFVLTASLFIALWLGIVVLEHLNVHEIGGRATVVDGDSLLLDGKRLRLLGIDAPELHQTCKRENRKWKCGQAARAALVALVRSPVQCAVHGVDHYQRDLVLCRSEGKEVNAAMVEAGWALDYGGYVTEENRARAARRGIWSSVFDVPEDWRRAQGIRQNRVQETTKNNNINSALSQSWAVFLSRWWRSLW